MEAEKITYVPDLKQRCSLFCGLVGVDSPLNIFAPHLGGNVIHTESRMIILRRKFVKSFVTVQDENEFKIIEQRYAEAIFMVSSLLLRMTLGNENIRDWFAANTTMEDWASVMREYDVFGAFVSKKKWTAKKIRYVKRIYGNLHNANLAVTENPENRS